MGSAVPSGTTTSRQQYGLKEPEDSLRSSSEVYMTARAYLSVLCSLRRHNKVFFAFFTGNASLNQGFNML